MAIKRMRIFLPVALILQMSTGIAQVKNYSVRHYTTEDGLPQHSVTSIGFDKAGFCWISTEMGLVRFDGNTFTVFNSNNLPAIRSDRFRLVTADSAGNLYVRNDSWQHFMIDVNGDSRSYVSPFPRLLDKSSPVCFVKGRSIQNARLAATLNSVEREVLPFHPEKGGVYGLTSNTLSFAINGSFAPIYPVQDKNGLKYLTAGELMLLFEHNNSLKAWKNGVLQPAVQEIQGPIKQNKDYQAGRFSCFSTANQSYIYAGKTLYGIFWQQGMLISKILLENIDIPVMSEVYYHPAYRCYFIGSLVAGLYIVSLSDFSFPAQAPGAMDEGFYSQALTSKGGIICQRYLYPGGGAPVKLPIDKLVGASLFLNNKQQLYYGDEPQLLRYDLLTGIHKKIMDLDSRPASIYYDRFDSNVVILTTSHGIGKMTGDSLHNMQLMPFKRSIIRSVQAGKDTFLIATETGLKWYDFAHHKIFRSVLDSLYIRALYTEPGGRVWIGSYNKGSYLYENGRLYKIPDNGYEALRTVHAFIEDNHGNLWMPTNDGLFTIKKEMLRSYAIKGRENVFYHLYSVFDNLPTNEFNGGCTPNYIWTKDSLLSIPSIAGLVQFYPDKVQPVVPLNKIYVDELQLNDSIVHFSADNNLTVAPDYNRLTIMITCPYYGARENIKLVYKIEGDDKEWTPVPVDGKIKLNRMAAGSYHFLIRKVTGDGTDGKDSVQFTVTVRPWFYNTWWFHMLVAAALALIVFVLAKMRIRLLNERNNRLKAIIQEQTADLSTTVSQLRQSEQALKESNRTKDNVITMVLHDLRSPIRFLNTVSHQLANRHRTMTSDEMDEKFSLLKSSTASLNSFTEQFFAWAVSQQKTFTVKKEQFLLQDLFLELEELYRDIVATNHNLLTIQPTSIELYTDKNILSAIIRNLIDNASKHTTNGMIIIDARAGEEAVHISVADTGTGLSAAEIEAYYDLNKQAGKNGNGSIIVMQLLQTIDGKLTIQSRAHGGAVFNVALNRR